MCSGFPWADCLCEELRVHRGVSRAASASLRCGQQGWEQESPRRACGRDEDRRLLPLWVLPHLLHKHSHAFGYKARGIRSSCWNAFR